MRKARGLLTVFIVVSCLAAVSSGPLAAPVSVRHPDDASPFTRKLCRAAQAGNCRVRMGGGRVVEIDHRNMDVIAFINFFLGGLSCPFKWC